MADGHAVAEAPIDPDARTATFRIGNWDATRDVRTIGSSMLRSEAGTTQHIWAGTIRRDPVDQPVITVADVSCNTHAGVSQHAATSANMAKLNPDLHGVRGRPVLREQRRLRRAATPLEPRSSTISASGTCTAGPGAS